MPVTFYSSDEYGDILAENVRLKQSLKVTEDMRPQWAQGFTSDSVAAQVTSAALRDIWDLMEVTNQTDCMRRIRILKLDM